MSLNQDIETGDYVKLINEPTLNGGIQMSVADTNETQAMISYFDGAGVHKEVWVEKADLVLIHKAQGGFRDAGEAP